MPGASSSARGHHGRAWFVQGIIRCRPAAANPDEEEAAAHDKRQNDEHPCQR